MAKALQVNKDSADDKPAVDAPARAPRVPRTAKKPKSTGKALKVNDKTAEE